MGTFNELFGAQTLLPSNFNYLALDMAASVILKWPLEQQDGGPNVVADVIDVNASVPGLNIDMPDATLVSNGTSALLNNVGPNTVTLRDAAGGTITSLASGAAWQIYLRSNTTAAGLWRSFQFGASVSVANAAALAGAGLKAIGATLNTRIPVVEKNVNYVILDSDRAVSLNWTAGVGSYTLPNAATVGSDWYVIVKNLGNGDLTVAPPSGTIDGAATKAFPAGSSGFVVSDGVNYFTLGFGSGSGGSGGGFSFLVIPVAGSGDYILSGAELDQVGYRFTGILTGTRNIIVPGSVDEYWVDNQTTGAFSLFVKTAAQVPGIEVLQNNRNILYCDGTNVIPAETATVSFPIPVAQGGTGAINAAAARTNLGAGAAGSNIFVAATQALAQTALGITLAGSNTWAAQQIFAAVGTTATPAVRIASTFANLQFYETDGAVDNKNWHITVNGEQMLFRIVDDAGVTAVDFLTIDRTGIAAGSLISNFGNGILQYAGREVGWKDLPRTDDSGSVTLVDAYRGTLRRYVGVGGHTYFVDSGQPITAGGVITISNEGGGTINIAAAGAGQIRWMNGSGAIPVGNRTLAVGGLATIYALASTPVVYVYGPGVL
jgi:hypothetical protein